MRTREKLTLEEKFALALELLKRERSLEEIRSYYRVSHTTAYKIRNTFLNGGRAALSGEREAKLAGDLEARVSALESLVGDRLRWVTPAERAPAASARKLVAPRRVAK